MKIVVTTNGADLSAQTSPIFGRCPTYVFVDTETMAFEAIDNPAVGASGGAGVQAAQFVIERGAQAVITGSTGPNAFQVFQSAGIPVYLNRGGTVREAVEAHRAGRLQVTGGASAAAHAGMGTGRGAGRGTGMGRGTGRGMGRGLGMGTAPGAAAPPAPGAPPAPAPASSRDGEIAALKDAAGSLRKQLAELTERLDQLAQG